jgi:beta-1,4-mannosyl-glycoprotein beta-1,4-N-acetylglucosaminyltransferase
MQGRVIDAFIFYNEMDMLDYRLNLLNSKVDYFVLVEATRTHVGKDKILYYNENRQRFAPFADKIIHVICTDLTPDPQIKFDEQWWNEKLQRNAISIGLDRLPGGLRDNDVVFICDVDEIWDADRIGGFVASNIQSTTTQRSTAPLYARIPMDMYYYDIQHRFNDLWIYASIVNGAYIKTLPIMTELSEESIKMVSTKRSKVPSPNKYPLQNQVRNISDNVREISTDGSQPPVLIMDKPVAIGWHLSYFMDEEGIENKLKNFGHQEYNSTLWTRTVYIRENIEKGIDLFGRKYETENLKFVAVSENSYLPPKGLIYPRSAFPFVVFSSAAPECR